MYVFSSVHKNVLFLVYTLMFVILYFLFKSFNKFAVLVISDNDIRYPTYPLSVNEKNINILQYHFLVVKIKLKFCSFQMFLLLYPVK